MKNILITGANSDLGKSLIEKFSKFPANKILAVSRGKVKNQIGNVDYLDSIDLDKEEDLEKLAERVNDTFFEKFIFIHSVGNFWYHKSIQKTSFSEATKMMDSHYNTLYGTIQCLMPIFRKNNGGRIIAFSCNSVGYSYPEMAAFTSAKAAVETLIRCVANENSKYGVVANAIALSTINTEKVVECQKDSKYHKDYITTDELIEVVQDLTNASPLINGNIIKVLKYSEFFYNEGYFQRNPSCEHSDSEVEMPSR